jgi:NTE family protein
MEKRALVLGSGGPVGIAWETGLLAGLAEAGVDLSDTDFIVGTSAGAIVGAQIAMGKTFGDLAASILSESSSLSRPLSHLSALPDPDFTNFIDKMDEAISGKRSAREVRVEIGKWALRTETIGEEMFIAVLGYIFGEFADDCWPDRKFACTAVDTLSGEFVVWDKDAGASLKRAIASSCSVPGFFPPITINGRRYMDGGTHSATNADLAKGYDTAVVLAVSGTAGDPGMAAQFRRQLDYELAVLRDSGTRFELVAPDASSIRAFGPNLMDPRNAAAAVDAGLAQGNAEAAKLRGIWGRPGRSTNSAGIKTSTAAARRPPNFPPTYTRSSISHRRRAFRRGATPTRD